MAQAAVTIKMWKALHTGGTKFYQIISFHSANGHSFSIRHYGPKAMFNGLGKASMGTVEMDDDFSLVKNGAAGRTKRLAKSRDGYSKDVEENSVNCGTIPDSIEWIRQNLGAKIQGEVRQRLLSPLWEIIPDSLNPPARRKPPASREESDLNTSPDWGTW